MSKDERHFTVTEELRGLEEQAGSNDSLDLMQGSLEMSREVIAELEATDGRNITPNTRDADDQLSPHESIISSHRSLPPDDVVEMDLTEESDPESEEWDELVNEILSALHLINNMLAESDEKMEDPSSLLARNENEESTDENEEIH